jgi:formylglycine-generating enzyme
VDAPDPRVLRRSLIWILLAATGASLAPPTLHPAAREPSAHEWTRVEDTYWQIQSRMPVEDLDLTDAVEGTRGRCTPGTVEVEGQAMAEGSGYFDVVEQLQRLACVEWISRTFPERCGRFDEARWKLLSAGIPRRPMHFCIDRFEYPNRRGAFPWIMVTWNEARALCAREGERLCSEAEWTFACEGPAGLPYPNGYARDPDACVIDRPWRVYDNAALAVRDSERARDELDHLWQGEASGSRPQCRSPFGVYDMTGNVDEWTSSVVPGERPSILKGGYWGPVRTRCRPSTRVHGEDYYFYQQGFRCCRDAAPAVEPG